MLFPDTVTGELLEVVSSSVRVEQLEMDREELDERKGFGSVKAAINFYGERIPKGNFQQKKSQTSYSEKPSSRIGDLRQARKNAVQLSESKKVADSVKSQAESELLSAKKTVKELTRRIEQSNSRVKAQIENLEKINNTARSEGDHGVAKDYQNTEMMRRLANAKQELSKLKLDIATISEEKRKAEKEREALIMEVDSCSNSVEALAKEIDKLNEEHVLVELARLEASKEREAIEAQWKEATKQYSAKLEETRKNINNMMHDVEGVEELERKLAITTDDANVLESELKQVKEMDKFTHGNNLELDFQKEEQTESSSALISITREVEASKKELGSIKAEGFQLMASMDIIRKELNGIMEEMARLNRKEAFTDLTIQNLNSKFLRANSKLEAVSAAEKRAQSVLSNLLTTLEQVKSEAESAERERVLSIEDTKVCKEEILKIESEIDLTEEKFLAALQELKTAKSSEAKVLEKLKTLTEKTMQNRALASQHSSTITISTFEHEYLTGCAVRAAEIADKKVAAAQAWVEALRASEKEILMKLNSEKKEDSKREESLSAKSMVQRELENWRQKFEEFAGSKNSQSQVRQIRRSMTGGIRFTPTGRARLRMTGSPGGKRTPKSASFSINRRKVMPNLAQFFSGKGIDGGLKAM